jgi:Cu(I)/Ag(I) efflux system membrane fusion protein
MCEPSEANWKRRLRGLIEPLVGPALLLGAGVLVIVALGIAQRVGWITTGGGDAPPAATAGNEETLYICPMMCTPPSKEPGRCPVCGMELVPSSSGGEGGDERSIAVDAVSRRIANIQTAPVKSKAVSRQMRAVGQLSYDEGRLKTLAAYVDGRIDRLYADYTGVVVNRGDDLALLYSPELYTAQTELLSARRAAKRSGSSAYSGVLDSQNLYESARQKLIDLGMTEKQVARLEESGKATTRITLVAPIHGTVIARLGSEGEYVKTGQPIYRLADLSHVWLMLEFFPEDAAAIRYGQRVEAEVQSLPGEEFSGRVAFVDPMVDPKTRTVGVRVVIENEDGRLKIGDYATATVNVPLGDPDDLQAGIYDPELAGKWISPRHPHVIADGPGQCRLCGIGLVPASKFGFTEEPVEPRKQLVVPRNAVLMAGNNSVVYVETEPGRFELRRVELGPSLGDEIVLLAGVEEGEQVATRGNFLIDSQMQLAGNPSLIDPTKAAPKPVDESPESDPKIEAALAKLPEEDPPLARKQRICPVTEAPLGSMGVPPKVDVEGRTVFICCEGCRQPLLDDPEKYLAVLDAAKDETASGGKEDGAPAAPGLPPIGPIQLLEGDQ